MRPSRLVTGIFLVAVLFLSGCSKKESSSGVTRSNAPAPTYTMLEKLPANTAGFYVINASTPQFKAMQDLGLYQGGYEEAIEQLKQMPQQNKFTEIYLTILSRTGIFDFAAGKPAPFKEMSLFFIPQDSGFEVGTYISGNGSKDYSQISTQIKEIFAEYKVETSDLNAAGKNGFSVELSPLLEMKGDSKEPPSEADKAVEDVSEMLGSGKFIFLADKDSMTIASSEEIASGYYNPSGNPAILGTAEYRNAMAQLRTRAKELAFGYVDITAPLKKAAEADPSAASLNQLPFRQIAANAVMNKELSTHIVAPITVTSENLKKIAGVLKGSGKHSALESISANAILALSLDDSFLSGVQEAALKNAPPEKQQMVRMQFAPIQGISGLGLAIGTPPQGQPIPEITIVAKSSNPQGLKSQLQQMAAMFGAFGGGMAPWQEQDIDGNKAMATNVAGVSVFLANNDSGVALTSSRNAVKQFLVGGGNTLAGSLTTAASNIITQYRSPIFIHFDYKKFGELFASLGQTLSMFTGGEQGDIGNLFGNIKDFGILSVGISESAKSYHLDITYSK